MYHNYAALCAFTFLVVEAGAMVGGAGAVVVAMGVAVDLGARVVGSEIRYTYAFLNGSIFRLGMSKIYLDKVRLVLRYGSYLWIILPSGFRCL